MSLSVLKPQVTAAGITPNPVNMNSKATLTVQVMEQAVILDSEAIFANEFMSGEV